MRFSLKAVLLSLLIPVLFPLTSLASEMGVTQDEFLARYTKAVDDYNTSYAAMEGLREKKTIKKEQLSITRYSPNNVLEIIINGASAFKDPMGNMILLTDDSTQFSNSEITLDVAMALYAFDPSFQEVRQATQLYVDLSHSKTGTISHGNVDYTILNQNGTMLQIEAVYRGYTPILGITPTPSPEDSAEDTEETDTESSDTESADASDASDSESADASGASDTGSEDASGAADTGSEEAASGQDAGTAEDASDQDGAAAEAPPTPTPVASVLVYPGASRSSDSETETSTESNTEDSTEAESSQSPETETSSDSDITPVPTLTPSATPTPRPSVKPPMAARPSVTPVPSPLPPKRQ